MADDPWPKTRASIIFRLQDPSDQEAWNLVVEIYTPLVYRYCVSRGLQEADASDVTQEVLSKLQNFEYRPDRGRFRAWMGTVARNQVLQFWRKSKKQQAEENELESRPTEPDLDWEKISHAHILQSALTRIQSEFQEDAWSAFEKVALAVVTENEVQRFVWKEDGSAPEVASQLSRPVEWVYKIKSKILQRLRDEILFIAEELAVLE